MTGRLAGAAALAALCVSCASVSDPAAFAVAAQDRYDFLPCNEIIAAQRNHTNRTKELSELAAKAETSPGGFIASYAAYRSDLAQQRGLLAAANRAAAKNNCPPPK